MPELPEVEVLRRSLVPHLLGEEIRAVQVRQRALREPVDEPGLQELVGARVDALERRAKYLLVRLSNGRTLVVHLGMSGNLTVVRKEAPRRPHEHVVFTLASGRELRFVDPRRFGLVLALPTGELGTDRRFAGLGIEPLGEGFDGHHLGAAARGRRGPVKTFLMDASVVVGVGNIYASEALFRARIHPRRSVARLSGARLQQLAEAVREVLADATRQGGTTLNDFSDGLGQRGYFQVELAVYDRAGEPCSRCGAAIRRIVLGQRSTYYCPRCQR